MLEDHANLSAQPGQTHPARGDLLAENTNGSRCRPLEKIQAAEQRALARAAAPDDHHHFSFRDLEVYPLEHFDGAEVLVEVVGLDRDGARGGIRSGAWRFNTRGFHYIRTA